MCGYEIVVNTPVACTRDMEEAVLRRLQQLDVYGFGSEDKKNVVAPGAEVIDAVDADTADSTAVPEKKSPTVLSQEYKQKKLNAAKREQDEDKAEGEKNEDKEEKVVEETITMEAKVEVEVEVDAQGQGSATGDSNVKVVPVKDLGAEKAKTQAGKRGRRDPPGKQQGAKKPYRVTFNE